MSRGLVIVSTTLSVEEPTGVVEHLSTWGVKLGQARLFVAHEEPLARSILANPTGVVGVATAGLLLQLWDVDDPLFPYTLDWGHQRGWAEEPRERARFQRRVNYLLGMRRK